MSLPAPAPMPRRQRRRRGRAGAAGRQTTVTTTARRGRARRSRRPGPPAPAPARRRVNRRRRGAAARGMYLNSMKRSFGTVETGTIRLGNLPLYGTNFENSPIEIFARLLNPASFNGTRLALLARAYERYKYLSAWVEYRPTCATSLGGQFYMCLDTDPSDPTFTDREIAINNINDTQGAARVNVHSIGRTMLPVTGSLPSYMTQSGTAPTIPRDQARLRIVQSVPLTGFNGVRIDTNTLPISYGELYLHYRIKFMVPSNEQPATVNPNAFPGSVRLTNCLNTEGSASTNKFAWTGITKTSKLDGISIYTTTVSTTTTPPTDGVYVYWNSITPGSGVYPCEFNYLSGSKTGGNVFIAKTLSGVCHVAVITARFTSPSPFDTLVPADSATDLVDVNRVNNAAANILLSQFEPDVVMYQVIEQLRRMNLIPQLPTVRERDLFEDDDADLLYEYSEDVPEEHEYCNHDVPDCMRCTCGKPTRAEAQSERRVLVTPPDSAWNYYSGKQCSCDTSHRTQVASTRL